MISLSGITPPDAVEKWGSEVKTLTAPQKLKVQLIGAGDATETMFHDGPPAGKRWEVTTTVHVFEYDA